ncbi:MAG: COP23 domain-containing protein [Coleofasciculus sp. B1-GNL1-01]|uniref:COP23 domain-containing protein n=1 Tax=Coleofasciculus sp. B1-GNL1-01 TaxID=3068484 RepID=UPI0032FE91D6
MKASSRFPVPSTQMTRNRLANRVSVGLKTTGWSASLAIVLASTNGLAVNPVNQNLPVQNQLQRDATVAQNNTDDPRFTCQFFEGEYTVMYHPESQPEQAYAWATPSLMGGGWTPERRCNEISRRLEFYRPDGLLEMRTATENNYNIICVTTQKNPDCQIVLTVPPGQDPQLTRDRVFENLTVADSGQATDAVTTFIEDENRSDLLDRVLNEGLSVLGMGKPSRPSSESINLRPFLDPADGGTGTQLRQETPGRSTPRLNPDNFR